MGFGLDGLSPEEKKVECRRRALKAWETTRRRHPPKPKAKSENHVVDPEYRRRALKAWDTIRAKKAAAAQTPGSAGLGD